MIAEKPVKRNVRKKTILAGGVTNRPQVTVDMVAYTKKDFDANYRLNARLTPTSWIKRPQLGPVRICAEEDVELSLCYPLPQEIIQSSGFSISGRKAQWYGVSIAHLVVVTSPVAHDEEHQTYLIFYPTGNLNCKNLESFHLSVSKEAENSDKIAKLKEKLVGPDKRKLKLFTKWVERFRDNLADFNVSYSDHSGRKLKAAHLLFTEANFDYFRTARKPKAKGEVTARIEEASIPEESTHEVNKRKHLERVRRRLAVEDKKADLGAQFTAVDFSGSRRRRRVKSNVVSLADGNLPNILAPNARVISGWSNASQAIVITPSATIESAALETDAAIRKLVKEPQLEPLVAAAYVLDLPDDANLEAQDGADLGSASLLSSSAEVDLSLVAGRFRVGTSTAPSSVAPTSTKSTQEPIANQSTAQADVTFTPDATSELEVVDGFELLLDDEDELFGAPSSLETHQSDGTTSSAASALPASADGADGAEHAESTLSSGEVLEFDLLDDGLVDDGLVGDAENAVEPGSKPAPTTVPTVTTKAAPTTAQAAPAETSAQPLKKLRKVRKVKPFVEPDRKLGPLEIFED